MQTGFVSKTFRNTAIIKEENQLLQPNVTVGLTSNLKDGKPEGDILSEKTICNEGTNDLKIVEKTSQQVNDCCYNFKSKTSTIFSKFDELCKFNFSLDKENQVALNSGCLPLNDVKSELIKSISEGTELTECRNKNISVKENISWSQKFQKKSFGKINKSIHQSRLFQKLEKIVESFFQEKVRAEPSELEKYKDDKDYYWKKLDYLKEKCPLWTNECFKLLSMACEETTESRISPSANQIAWKLLSQSHVDKIVFTLQSNIERHLIKD